MNYNNNDNYLNSSNQQRFMKEFQLSFVFVVVLIMLNKRTNDFYLPA
jgi:hypothetical protein